MACVPPAALAETRGQFTLQLTPQDSRERDSSSVKHDLPSTRFQHQW